MRVEAEHVVGEQAFVDRSPNRIGQHAPEIGLGPRNVDEVDKRSVRLCVSDEPRREVEVVVVEEDGSVRLRLELGECRIRKRTVDGHVAVFPGVVQPAVDVGRVGEGPQVVLQEPERRVGDDVVEPVVGGRIVVDEAETVRRAVPGALLDRRASRLVTSWWETRLRSAVTRPPPPRRATRLPSSSRKNETGPRLETTISLRRSPMCGGP